MRAVHFAAGPWSLVLHGMAAVQLSAQGTRRGDTQLGAVDWEMLMARRPAGHGVVELRLMTSLEALALGRRGYPELLQTGARLHDRQHPHDAIMEVAGSYEHALARGLAWSAYAAAVGEPALGPVAYMHRPSADGDLFAPLGHHWQDAAHVSHGVITGGVYSGRVRVELSAFNGREPDDDRFRLDFRGARLDSYAARATAALGGTVTTSAWWGYIYDHERRGDGGAMHRAGASLLGVWPHGRGRTAAALVWGRNVHHHTGADHALAHGGAASSPHHPSDSWLAEATRDITPALTLFGRVEAVEKNADELGFLGGDLTQRFAVRALSLGGTRRIGWLRRADLAFGVRGAVSLVPETLAFTYGTRRPLGGAVYLRLRPN